MEGKMSKEELLKYLIAEIDLIMHDKDYRFENTNGTWYSRESCRDLTNEEVFEELRTELRQFADLEAKLAEKDRVCDKLQRDIECLEENYAQLESDYEKANELGLEPSYIKRVIKENEELKQQLAEKNEQIESYKQMLQMLE